MAGLTSPPWRDQGSSHLHNPEKTAQMDGFIVEGHRGC